MTVSMLQQWQCSQHRMRTVLRRIYAAHFTVYRGIIEQLEQVAIDEFPTAFVTKFHRKGDRSVVDSQRRCWRRCGADPAHRVGQ
jgi:hypothetical protein